jgi:hypothetical protein
MTIWATVLVAVEGREVHTKVCYYVCMLIVHISVYRLCHMVYDKEDV